MHKLGRCRARGTRLGTLNAGEKVSGTGRQVPRWHHRRSGWLPVLYYLPESFVHLVSRASCRSCMGDMVG